MLITPIGRLASVTQQGNLERFVVAAVVVVVHRSVVPDSLRPHGLQHTGSFVLHCLLEFAQIHVH